MERTKDILNSVSVNEAPDTRQRRTAYNADLQAEYIGFAPYGYSQYANVWTIYKITYDENKQEVLKQTGFSSWAERTTATYA